MDRLYLEIIFLSRLCGGKLSALIILGILAFLSRLCGGKH